MDAYIGISKKTINLFKKYGAKENKCFISPLSIDNKDFKKSYRKYEKRKYDILLCGRFIPRKLFDFSINVSLNSVVGCRVSKFNINGTEFAVLSLMEKLFVYRLKSWVVANLFIFFKKTSPNL